jgi:hypothetical protein
MPGVVEHPDCGSLDQVFVGRLYHVTLKGAYNGKMEA